MKRFYFLFACFLLLAGCGSTKIISQDARADIYVDDRWIGLGEGKVSRVGPPKTVLLKAKREGEIVGTTTMSRSFSFKTVLWAMVSYYSGFYWAWYYPALIVIPVDLSATGTKIIRKSAWSDSSQSIWMQPLK